MEERLKRERNRLFLRIILILLAVWLTVSAVFCAVRLNTEKVNVQSSELSNLNQIKQLIIVGFNNLDVLKQFYIEDSPDTQIIVTDIATKQVIADTTNTVIVSFAWREGADSVGDYIGLLDFYSIRRSLSDSEYQSITDLLQAETDDGSYYELICTRFQIKNGYVIPLELKMVLVDGSDARFVADGNIALFDLSSNKVDGERILEGIDTRRNTIPKDFALTGAGSKDIISSLTKEQRRSAVDMIQQNAFDYIFYASDYFGYQIASDDMDNTWLIQYAKEVNIFHNCKIDLAVGVAMLFGFFFTIAAILCVMIWRTVRTQLIQEQKRMDLTNALAHDIKTPLFVISGYAYSLKENIDETERDLYIDKIIEQTDEVNGLVHRMLTFSKLDSYKMTLNRTDVDLGELTESILQNYAALPDNKRVSFSKSGSNTVSADRELLKTALQNLIDNAAKYSLKGSVIRISVTGRTITIVNESEPLTKDDLKQIWKPYVRKDKSRHQKGNGLGLSIVKSIIELHKARIDMSMKDSTLTCTIEF